MASKLLNTGLLNRSISLSNSTKFSSLAIVCSNYSIKNRLPICSSNSSFLNYPSFRITRNLSTSLNLFNFTSKNQNFDLKSANEFVSVVNAKELIDISDSIALDNFVNATNNLVNTANQTIQNTNTLNQIVSSSDIGLWPYWTTGLFYDFLCILHNYLSISWVTSIAVACLILRVATFPLVVDSKKSTAEFLKRTISMQTSVSSFGQMDDVSKEEYWRKHADASKNIQSVQKYLPRMMFSPIAQGLIFGSFYFTLRAMAKYPIESMQQESFFWVESLTQCDPYYIFPLLTSTSMFLLLKYNMEMNNLNNPQGNIMKYFTLILPVTTFAFTCTMPANLTIYWFINNIFAVSQFFFLTILK